MMYAFGPHILMKPHSGKDMNFGRHHYPTSIQGHGGKCQGCILHNALMPQPRVSCVQEKVELRVQLGQSFVSFPGDPARPLWERRRAVQVLAICHGHMSGLGRELMSNDAKALGPALFQSLAQPCSTAIPGRYKTVRLCPLSLRCKVL